MKVCLVVPILNEITGLKAIMPKVNPEWVDRILIVDGGSTDGSIEYAKEQGWDVCIQKGRGVRNAYLSCYPLFREDIIITFSPDGNSIPETIPVLIDKMKEGYDMVIASRYMDDAESEDDTKITRIGNWFFSFIISLFGFKYTDAMVMFRAYKKELPEKLKLNQVRSPLHERILGRYVSWEPQMSERAAKAKLKIAEIPSSEPLRIDETGDGVLLATSRIHHYKAGLACFIQYLEEWIFYRI
jgi:glycosyltransferase involved in cell wall biosynthesis